MPSAVEPSPVPASLVHLAEPDTQLTTVPAGLGVLFQNFLLQVLLQRHHYLCNVPHHTRRHNRRDTITRATRATNLTLSTTQRVQDLRMVTVPLNWAPDIRMEDKPDNRYTTGRLYFSNQDTHRLPSGPGCNSSYNYSLATWARSVNSSATMTYTTCFDVNRCLRYFRIA